MPKGRFSKWRLRTSGAGRHPLRKGTQPQDRQTWPVPPSAPPLEVEDTPHSTHTFHIIRTVDRELNAHHSWNLREHVSIRGMQAHFARSEDVMADVGKLKFYLLAPSDVAGIIAVLAHNACEEGGYMSRRAVNVSASKHIRKDTTRSCRKPSSS